LGEAGLEHLVSLIQHKKLQVKERHASRAEQVHSASRSSHYNVHAALQCLDLGIHGNTTHSKQRRQPLARDAVELFGHLLR